MTDIDDSREIDLEQAAQLLAELRQANAAATAAQAQAAAIAARLAASGAVEQLEGLMLEQVLVLESRLCHSDARFLITAGEVLADMPVLAGLLRAGQVSWSVVRQIVWQVRALGAVKRDHIDQRLAATLAQHRDIRRFDPDKLLAAVDQAVTELRTAAQAERAEARARRDNYLAVQTDFDGGIRGQFRFDPVTGAIVLNALDDAADHISRANDESSGTDAAEPGEDDDVPAADGGADVGGTEGLHPDHGADEHSRTTDENEAPAHTADDPRPADLRRGRQLGQALERMAHAWLSGAGPNGTAKPALVVHVRHGDIHPNAAGQIELHTRGALLPSITAATLAQLTRDATLRTVIFDGATPLATAAKRTALDVPGDVRFAVAARDGGDRFPGSSDPLRWCDLHHLVERNQHVDHHPNNLAHLTRRNHVLVHRHGWAARIDPATGALTIERRGKSHTSLPPGTPLARAPDQRPPPPTSRPDRATRWTRSKSGPRPGPAPPSDRDLPF